MTKFVENSSGSDFFFRSKKTVQITSSYKFLRNLPAWFCFHPYMMIQFCTYHSVIIVNHCIGGDIYASESITIYCTGKPVLNLQC